MFDFINNTLWGHSKVLLYHGPTETGKSKVLQSILHSKETPKVVFTGMAARILKAALFTNALACHPNSQRISKTGKFQLQKNYDRLRPMRILILDEISVERILQEFFKSDMPYGRVNVLFLRKFSSIRIYCRIFPAEI